MRLIAILLSLLCASILVCGCHPSEQSKEERHRDQILTLNLFSEPPTLDPAMATDTTSGIILGMLFEGLTKPSADGSPQLAIAESYDLSDDATTYTFHLRQTFWSNGTPTTAHDFEYAWKRSLSPSFPADYAYQLYFIKGAKDAKEGSASLSDVGIHATDAYTLVVELENPTPFFLELLHLSPYYPLNKAVVELNPNWAFEAGPDYVSNGPFELQSWSHNNQIVVVRNPHYWDAGQVKLSKIVAMMVEDTNTELALFEKGTIDWAGKPVSMGLPSDSLPSLNASGRLEYHSIAATYFYVFNMDRPPFNNVNIRKAFAYALNRNEIVKNITLSREVPATCIVPAPLTLQPDECFPDGDNKTAKTFFEKGLKELGLTRNQLPTLTLSYNTGEGHHKIAQAVQQQWHEAFGIEVKLENQEWKVYLDKLNQRDFMIARMSWSADYSDPYSFLDMFKYADGHINYTKWSNPAYTALLDESLHIANKEQRWALLRKAEKMLVDEMPLIPVYFLTNSFLHDPELKGYFLSPIGGIDFRNAYFDVSP